MELSKVSLCLVGALTLFGYAAWGATVSGVVQDSEGAPLKGAFVEARRTEGVQIRNFAVVVLSDKQGRYRIENLSRGDYQLSAWKNGYEATTPAAVELTDGQTVSRSLDLTKSKVRWTELSIHEGKMLLPDGPGKAVFFAKCIGCHGYQHQVAAMRRDREGWRRAVRYMREEMRAALWKFTDLEENVVADWFYKISGVHSDLPASPEEMPNFAEHGRDEFSDAAMNIVYRVYELPRTRMFPFSARPDGQGKIWIPFYHQNSAGMLDPQTGNLEIHYVHNPGDPLAGRRVAIHSVSPEDQVVWLAAADANKLGRLDRRTGEIGLIAPPPAPPPGGRLGRGSVHDVWSDSNGIVWTAGNPLQRFDPKTGEWNQFREMPDTYGMVIDQNGDTWATEFEPGGALGKVDGKTLKVTKYYPPNKKAHPRRVVADSKGNIWVGDWSGALLRFDSKTKTFQEYKIPGVEPTPYAMQVDRNDNVWFTSHYNDYLGRLDPRTGEFTKYPLPVISDIGSREMFRDSQGRLWFASPPNDKIISFMPPAGM